MRRFFVPFRTVCLVSLFAAVVFFSGCPKKGDGKKDGVQVTRARGGPSEDNEKVTALVEKLHSKDPQTRLTAVKGLAKCRDPRTLGAVV
jgi:hypothetical protein